MGCRSVTTALLLALFASRCAASAPPRLWDGGGGGDDDESAPRAPSRRRLRSSATDGGYGACQALLVEDGAFLWDASATVGAPRDGRGGALNYTTIAPREREQVVPLSRDGVICKDSGGCTTTM